MRIKAILARLGLVFAIYSALRLVFFAFNSHIFIKYSAQDILHCFVNGLRFDLSALLFLNCPFVFISLFVTKNIYNSHVFQRSLKYFFVLTNIPFVMANLADTEYFKFTGNRMTADVFFIQHEAMEQIDQLVFNFWHIVVLAMACTYVVIKYFPKAKPVETLNKKIVIQGLQTALVSFLFITTLFLGARGGLQSKPIQPAHAYMSGFAELGVLTLNTTFTLIKSKISTQLKRSRYFSDYNAVNEELKQSKLGYQSNLPKQNVVLIILESYATEFWGAANTYKGYTPFLDSLAKEGLFFKNNYANGRRSIDALPAILFGLPVMMTTPIVRTNYYSNDWKGLGKTAKNHDYHASFFHGAKTGTMYFDAISALAGFDDYYPRERYDEKKGDFDGHWGIYDEPFMQYMVQELNKHPEPFISTVFTLSTHQPYAVPPQHEGQFPNGTLKIHASVGYTDYAVQKFFEAASKEPWYQNTLFVITGDHTQMSESEHYNSTLGRHRVPLLLYHPNKKLTVSNPDRITQHTDIMPTIMDFLGFHDDKHLLFGRSVLDDTEEGEAILASDGRFWLVRQTHYLQYNENEKKSRLYEIHDVNQKLEIKDKKNMRQEMENRIKAYIQLYRNGLIDNKLYQ